MLTKPTGSLQCFLFLGEESTSKVQKKKIEEHLTNNKDAYTAFALEKSSVKTVTCVNLLYYSTLCPFKWLGSQYYCFYCPEKFYKFSQLSEHNTAQHSNVTKIDIKEQVAKARKVHRVKTNIINAECKICNHKIADITELKNHLIGKHEIKGINVKIDGIIPYKITDEELICAICENKFDTFRNLTGHVNMHYKKFICDLCGAGFLDTYGLKVHKVLHASGNLNTCEICGKAFATLNSKQLHVSVVHLHKKRNKCPHCPATFNYYYSKKKHIAKEHKAEAVTYPCDMCSTKFYVKSALHSHRNHVHLKVKKHACGMCEWKFYNPSELKSHMASHGIVDKKYVCHFCNKVFLRRPTLRLHLRIHNNDKRFICDTCGSAFVQKCNLEYHMRTRHNAGRS